MLLKVFSLPVIPKVFAFIHIGNATESQEAALEFKAFHEVLATFKEVIANY